MNDIINRIDDLAGPDVAYAIWREFGGQTIFVPPLGTQRAFRTRTGLVGDVLCINVLVNGQEHKVLLAGIYDEQGKEVQSAIKFDVRQGYTPCFTSGEDYSDLYAQATPGQWLHYTIGRALP